MDGFPTTLPTPRFLKANGGPVLRWGVLAPGEIAAAFTHTLHTHTDQRVVAVASRSKDRAAAFGRDFGISNTYGSYDQLLDDDNVDIVYVAAPHSEHRRLALLAIAAGSHVLVEKPFAVTADEARDIVRAARQAGVFAMEAMWTRYLPQTDIIRQLLADGALGDVSLVTADLGFAAPYSADARWWNPSLGGGALLDLGVYPISFASFVLGAPIAVVASGTTAASGVDAQASLILESPNKAQSLLNASLLSETPAVASISGRLGHITIDSPFMMPSAITLHSPGGKRKLRWEDESGISGRDGLCYQAVAAVRYIREGLTESPWHSLDETVSVMETIDDARGQIAPQAAGVGNAAKSKDVALARA
ncbi:MAG: Gfo/Idh/MocA family oxidoreductase [Terrimicrobiaceae bacterium]